MSVVDLPYFVDMMKSSPDLISTAIGIGLCVGMGLMFIGSLFGFIIFRIFPSMVR